jgi:hypothetical protein
MLTESAGSDAAGNFVGPPGCGGGRTTKGNELLTALAADDEGLHFSAEAADDPRVVDLLLDDRRIWSFRVADADRSDPGENARRMAWPTVLTPYLHGVGEFALRPVDGGSDVPRATGRFGESDGPISFAAPNGVPLMINKWGILGHALGDQGEDMVPRLLDQMDRVRAILAEHTTLDVYVTGGTLLGPYRDGRIMPHDDDADLAYLSRHRHPVDVIREGFTVGRVLAREGITTLRCSAGHVQLRFEEEGRPDSYVDVFTGWIDEDGWWYQSFPVRHRARRDQLLPVGTLDVEGRPEPMPREPEVMLEALFGPGWGTPDPAFDFNTPPSTWQRMYGWLGDQHMDRARWRNFYRYGAGFTGTPSAYASWVADRLPAGQPVLELGTGAGDDALWLARRGHPVEAIDYVGLVTARGARRAAEQGLPARFRTMNLYDLRRMLYLGGETAARGEPVTVYARGLLGSLHEPGRENLWRLLGMVLRSGGLAHLDVPRETWWPAHGGLQPLHREVPLDALTAEAAGHGLRIDETHAAEEPFDQTPWGAGKRTLRTTRMVISWQPRTR